jgi:hypothetical protein
MDFNGPVPGIPGAVIRGVDELPDQLPDAEPAGRFSQAKPGHLLLDVPHIARFLVRDGKRIEVAVEPDADPGLVTLLLNGSARSALIHQCGELPLHAATLVPPGGNGAIAICGPSGVGKSTLAVQLSARGWILIADDTTRVTWNETHPMAWPSRDSIKLWRDTCEANNLDVTRLERVTMDLDKYYLSVPARQEPVRLAAVIELLVDGNRQQQQSALSPGERMAVLTRHACRQSYIRPLGRQADFARIVARVAGACRITRLAGARARPARDLADAIEQTVK